MAASTRKASDRAELLTNGAGERSSALSLCGCLAAQNADDLTRRSMRVRDTMRKPMMMRCFTCGDEFQFGPNIYAGTHIRAYNITVCRTCYSANWDGWAPSYEPKILKHLEEKGLPTPERNSKGWLPRGS